MKALAVIAAIVLVLTHPLAVAAALATVLALPLGAVVAIALAVIAVRRSAATSYVRSNR